MSYFIVQCLFKLIELVRIWGYTSKMMYESLFKLYTKY